MKFVYFDWTKLGFHILTFVQAMVWICYRLSSFKEIRKNGDAKWPLIGEPYSKSLIAKVTFKNDVLVILSATRHLQAQWWPSSGDVQIRHLKG